MDTTELLAEVSDDLFDDYTASDARWSETVLLRYFNAGQRQLVFLKPTAYVMTKVFRLSSGIEQNLPDGTANYYHPSSYITHRRAIELVKITRNMGTTGLVAGETIYPVSLKDMDAMSPGWRSVTEDATVVNYMFDPKYRTSFQVYPPQPASDTRGWVEAMYSEVPAPHTEVGDAMDVGEEYAEPIKNYMKYRAYGRDAALSKSSLDRSVAYWNLFLAQIGRKDLIEQRFTGKEDDSDKLVSQ